MVRRKEGGGKKGGKRIIILPCVSSHSSLLWPASPLMVSDIPLGAVLIFLLLSPLSFLPLARLRRLRFLKCLMHGAIWTFFLLFSSLFLWQSSSLPSPFHFALSLSVLSPWVFTSSPSSCVPFSLRLPYTLVTLRSSSWVQFFFFFTEPGVLVDVFPAVTTLRPEAKEKGRREGINMKTDVEFVLREHACFWELEENAGFKAGQDELDIFVWDKGERLDS